MFVTAKQDFGNTTQKKLKLLEMNELKPTYRKEIYKCEGFEKGSRLVYGASGIGGVWGEVNETESIDCLLYAFENGISSIDTSPSYNRSEEFVGKALKQWKGGVPFISTKVGRLPAIKADECYVDYSAESMKRSLMTSLERLGVDQVDLLFLHEPHLVPLDQIEAILETLQSFKANGYTKSIGVGGNPTDEFRQFITNENFEVVSGFLKMDACNLSGFEKDIPKFKKEGIKYYAASALHMGLLGNRFEKHVANPPNTEWVTHMDIATAKAVKKIADEAGLSISSLAQRYLFSINEADRIVMGARIPQQIASTVKDWNAGGLSEALFNQITETIISTRNI